MRALVTGASGFVGPHLMSFLASSGDDALGVDSKDGPDLLDAEGWRDLAEDAQPDVMYHLAGWSDVGASWKQPREAFRANAEGTLNVLEAARSAKVERVVVVSSADVYGIASPASLPLTEKAPVQPRSPYGASKVASEALARQAFRGWGLDVVIARPFNHIGPGQSDRFVAPAFAAKIAEAERVGGGKVTHGDLSPERDFTDVRDVVSAYRLLATEGRPGATYNICSSRAVSMSDILRQLVSLSSADISTEPDPDKIRPVEVPVLRGSHDRLTADTGWEPTIALADTLSDVLADFRDRIAPAADATDQSS